ncbi:hypothetical protein [Microvirga sp. M2]|uniref:hypothetical protein n=1 Tax=Microvirga sp. M2 TaxID=3073270 RepID=UPI0039C3369A
MKKVLVAAAGLMLISLPAFSQSSDDSGDRGGGYSRRDRGLEDLLRGIDDGGGMASRGPQRGAGFLLRSGDATLAVRCDPRDSMRACVDAATTLLERARNTMPGGGGGGGGGPGGTPPGGPPPTR